MKNGVFEQAAVEASAGLKEIDAEIDRIEARKESLLANRQLLQEVGRQLCTVMSVISVDAPKEQAHEAAPAHEEAEAVPAEQILAAVAEPEQEAHPVHEEEAQELTPVGAAAEAPEAEAPTFADLLSQSKPYSLRNDGWPAATPVAQRTLRSLL
jgi:hypothetical protein